MFGLWSTEWFVGTVLAPYDIEVLRDSTAWRNEAVGVYYRVNQFLSWPGRAEPVETDEHQFLSAAPPLQSTVPPTWQKSRAMLATLSVVAVVSLVAGGVSLYGMSIGQEGSFTYPPLAEEPFRSRFPGEEAMPEELGRWQRAKFEQATRSMESNFGAASNVWYYRVRNGDQYFMASFDFPFREFHPLWVCYDSIGWRVLSTQIVPGTETTWPIIEMQLQSELRGRAYVWFGYFDQYGVPLKADDAPLPGTPGERLSRNILYKLTSNDSYARPLTFQCQILYETAEEISESERQEFIGHLQKFMTNMRDASQPVLKDL